MSAANAPARPSSAKIPMQNLEHCFMGSPQENIARVNDQYVQTSWLGRVTVTEIVKRSHAVRLGPDSNGTWADNVLIVQLDVHVSIQCDLYPLAAEFDAQAVPLILRDRSIDVFDGIPAAVLRVVQRHIVLERVGPGDVVVVAILPAPHQAARGILLSGDRLELDLDRAVGQ